MSRSGNLRIMFVASTVGGALAPRVRSVEHSLRECGRWSTRSASAASEHRTRGASAPLSIPLWLRLTLPDRGRSDGRQGLLFLLEAFDDDLAGLARLQQSPFNELLDQRLVLLFVLVRQGVLVA